MSASAPISLLTSVCIGGQTDVVDLHIADGKIARITPAQGPAKTLILPLMADAHVHLDKTFTARRTGGGAWSLFDAIDRMDADKSNWTEDDLFDRASEAMTKAWHHGVGALRTHVDWMTAEMPTAWRVFTALKHDWKGRVDLQLASLSPIDVLAEVGYAIAAQVQANDGILGAFIYQNIDLERKVDQVFSLSDRHGVELDFHVDEGLDVTAQGFDQIVEQAGKRKDSASVLCGHACSLATRPKQDVDRVLGAAAAAGVGLVVLPTTNSYLQDHEIGRTPRLRGIAPMHEAAQAGMDVMIASDNVRDLFYPYGDYDLLDVFRGALPLGHLDAATWLPAISETPAKWCNSDIVTEIAVGHPANFITIAAPSLADAMSRPTAPRRVCRDGHFIQ